MLQLHELGSISIATLDAVTSSRAELAEAAAPGSELDAIVWEELEDRARGDSPVLIIGAMIVGPEYGPLSALATGLFLLVGEVSLDGSPQSRFLTAFVTEPNFFSFVVAFVAGIAGTIALTRGRQETLAGVLASVLTLAVHDRSERRKVRAGAR